MRLVGHFAYGVCRATIDEPSLSSSIFYTANIGNRKLIAVGPKQAIEQYVHLKARTNVIAQDFIDPSRHGSEGRNM